MVLFTPVSTNCNLSKTPQLYPNKNMGLKQQLMCKDVVYVDIDLAFQCSFIGDSKEIPLAYEWHILGTMEGGTTHSAGSPPRPSNACTWSATVVSRCASPCWAPFHRTGHWKQDAEEGHHLGLPPPSPFVQIMCLGQSSIVNSLHEFPKWLICHRCNVLILILHNSISQWLIPGSWMFRQDRISRYGQHLPLFNSFILHFVVDFSGVLYFYVTE